MASTAPSADSSEPAEDALALTPDGQRHVVGEVLPLSKHRREVSAHLRTNVLAMYGALVRAEGKLTKQDLRDYFVSFGSEEGKQGLYASFDSWWQGKDYDPEPNEPPIGLGQLRALPGVVPGESAERPDSLSYIGLNEEQANALGLSEEHTAPLSEYREAPKTVVRRHLDDVVGPHSDEHGDLLVLWTALRDADGPVTAEDINREYTLPSLSKHGGLADLLADLPGVKRRRENRRAEDVALADLETLADLRRAEERVEGPTETTFEYVGIGEGE